MKKLSTGIIGLDDILIGGYPSGGVSLLKGGPGTGKTIFCLSFANQCLLNNHQVSFLTSDEFPNSIIENMDNFGFAATKAMASKKLIMIDYCPVFSDKIVGHFQLDVILLRIKNSFSDQNRVLIIDSLQNLFIGLKKENHISVLYELFAWCRSENVTLLCTSTDNLNNGFDGFFEEYSSDCVISLNQQLNEKLMTRYLRVKKYRKSSHGTNEYPYLLNNKGVSVLPITNSKLEKLHSLQQLPTGIKELDTMLGGGIAESTSILISGASGTGKTLMGASVALAFAKRKKKVLLLSFEESVEQYKYNSESAGMDIKKESNDTMHIKSFRAFERSMEEHLIGMIDLVDEIQPDLLILDPLTSLLDIGSKCEVKSLLIRFISFLKNRKITVILLELLKEENRHRSVMGLSSIADTWIKLTQVQSYGKVDRTIQIVKSRGAKTINEVKELLITDKGLKIESPYMASSRLFYGEQKKEKRDMDLKSKVFFKKQVEEIESQIKKINKNNSESTELLNYVKNWFKLELLEKKHKIQMGLDTIEATNSLKDK